MQIYTTCWHKDTLSAGCRTTQPADTKIHCQMDADLHNLLTQRYTVSWMQNYTACWHKDALSAGCRSTQPADTNMHCQLDADLHSLLTQRCTVSWMQIYTACWHKDALSAGCRSTQPADTNMHCQLDAELHSLLTQRVFSTGKAVCYWHSAHFLGSCPSRSRMHLGLGRYFFISYKRRKKGKLKIPRVFLRYSQTGSISHVHLLLRQWTTDGLPRAVTRVSSGLSSPKPVADLGVTVNFLNMWQR